MGRKKHKGGIGFPGCVLPPFVCIDPVVFFLLGNFIQTLRNKD